MPAYNKYYFRTTGILEALSFYNIFPIYIIIKFKFATNQVIQVSIRMQMMFLWKVQTYNEIVV